MVRLISLLALAAALAVAYLIPSSASALGVNGCPPNFVLNNVEFIGFGPPTPDRNGDTFVCSKAVDNHPLSLVIDNNIPDPIAEGVTDSGSTVLVDTGTGEVLGG
jgi:hypothetical protein